MTRPQLPDVDHERDAVLDAFTVWERRYVDTDTGPNSDGWGPWSAYSRAQLDLIETGWHEHPTLGGWRDEAPTS